MKQKFRAEERDIRFMLSNKRKYCVPRNQRDYVWDINNLQDLWDDIWNTIVFSEDGKISEKKDYFIGSCVLLPNKSMEYQIIDGQQRFTTLLIFLSAICSQFHVLNKAKLQTSTYKYIQDTDDYGDQFFVLRNDHLSPFFENAILYKDKILMEPQNDQQRNVARAYEFYNEQLEGLKLFQSERISILTAIRDQILNLRIVEIIVEDADDGYTIFEILNARGKELEIQDLIKNWCMKKMPTTFPSDYVKDTWDHISGNIDQTSSGISAMKTFLNHYFVARYQKVDSEKEMYRYIRKNIKAANVKDFVDDIKEKSDTYLSISKPTIENMKGNKELLRLLTFFRVHRITQIKSLLLALFTHYYNGNLLEKDLMRTIKTLYRFHSVYTVICKKPSNVVEKVYYEYSNILHSECTKENILQLVKALKSKMPTYEEFEIRFIDKKYSNRNRSYSVHKKAVNHILHDFEWSLHKTDEFSMDNYSIEHISPDKGDDITSAIGNLLPLAKKINEKARDFELRRKIEIYETSELLTVRGFLKYHSSKDIWTKDDIENRTKKLQLLFIKMFGLYENQFISLYNR